MNNTQKITTLKEAAEQALAMEEAEAALPDYQLHLQDANCNKYLTQLKTLKKPQPATLTTDLAALTKQQLVLSN